MIKARVLVPLNIRTGKPEILSNNNTGDKYYNPGDVVEISESIIGEPYKDNNVWYKLEDGGFVWSGGVDKENSLAFVQNTPVNNDNALRQKVILKDATLKSGQGIVIGVMDSGIDTGHISLKNALLSNEDFLTVASPEIQNGHGTKVAGVLVGNDTKITGIVIDANIKSYRVIGNTVFTDELGLKNALKSIIDENIYIDILNLSLDISAGSASFFQPLIDKIALNGTIILVAGNEESIKQVNEIARLKNVIVVGVFQENEFIQIQNDNYPAFFHFLFLNVPIITTELLTTSGGHAPFGSSSAYTALTSGIVAGFLSNTFIPRGRRFVEVGNFLQKCSFNSKDDKTALPFKLYK